ncbi:MAG: isochorismate synthase [Verrucomicrobia bacterium]|nr:isochorismate synthase [Verrucomicrobiota bacterium]
MPEFFSQRIAENETLPEEKKRQGPATIPDSLPTIINGSSYHLCRLQIDLAEIDLIAWLESQMTYPKVFWKERDSHVARAAVGNLLTFPDVPLFSDSNPFDLRLYGGIRFGSNTNQEQTWQGFPSTGFWLPHIEITQENGRAHVIVYSLRETTPPEILDTIGFANRREPGEPLSLMERKETPDFYLWKQSVEDALIAISSGAIDKLVLARKTTLQFSKALSPWPLLRHLNERARRATLFSFQLTPHLCFLGATPEKLFQREKNLLSTDAVASTRPRGKTPEEDDQLEEELLSSPKEQREFKIVKDFLELALSPLSEKMDWDGQDRVLKASHVQHLHNRLNATLKTGVSDSDLIRALHPTPALGGYPQKEALKLLEEIERFDRGWYGAPVGMVGQNGASLYVAIRSALIRERELHLFAGTGLVTGSEAEKEWEELEQKIRPFMELFV